MKFTLFSLKILTVVLTAIGFFYVTPAYCEQQFTIGFSQATTTEPWRLLFNDLLRKEARKHKEINLLMRNAQDDVSMQIGHIEEFIQRRVDAILVSPKVSKAMTPIINQAFNNGIPTIILDRGLDNDRYTQFIGGDNFFIGQEAGRFAVKHLGGEGKAKGNIVEIWGGMASTPARDRHNGFFQVVSKEPGIKIVGKLKDGDWKQDKGYLIMSQFLVDHPQIDLVYAHNDPMAYGAYLAAKDVKRENKIAFIGIDGIPAEGVRWVDQGFLDATFLYMTPGAEGIRQVLRLLKGNPVPKHVILPSMMIDKTNSHEILKQHGLLDTSG
ncbi:MAG: substrate-binding domain-containing protein [Magnetococcales bacterium]|nr:substrate-binding domain-containing protein [Magnetococcales bacterium]